MDRLKQIGIDLEVHRAIERARRSFNESENDILRRLLVEREAQPRSPRETQNSSSVVELRSRVRGNWTVEIRGERLAAANLKDAYRTLLLQLHGADPSFLPAFAEEKGRLRRYVAKSPDELFVGSPHLAADHARQLVEGWWYDTNLSTEQVSKRARIAARVSGLRYGEEVRILENLREI
uniref:hypothetical protein n=1 Tax=uncultured Sphingomonas sp. TaxID=158754 RepID=UPI0025F31DB0|nr:hypothetical protein [uncultured Sphingomonas sp.]